MIANCLVIFSGHCDLDLDLVLRIIVSVADLFYYLRKESQIWYSDASLDDKVSHSILGSL